MAFCKMFGGRIPPVDPHPDNVKAPVGMERGAGKRTARMRALKENGAPVRSCSEETNFIECH